MSTMPTVSVILPTYNRAKLLPRAIASVLGQSFRDFELIVVDDGSTDETREVVQSIDDSRLIYLPPDKNLGDAGARNRGIALARGKWLAFQDSDDEWALHKLERQLSYAENLGDDVAAIGSTVLRVVGNGVERISWPLVSGSTEHGDVDRQRFIAGFCAYLQSIIVRRDAFTRLGGFDQELKARSDFEFCLRLIGIQRIAAVEDTLALSYETEDSISKREEFRCSDIHHLLTRHCETIEASPSVAAHYWYHLARSEFILGRRAASWSALIEVLRRDPSNSRAWILMILLPFGTGGIRWARRLRWSAARDQ